VERPIVWILRAVGEGLKALRRRRRYHVVVRRLAGGRTSARSVDVLTSQGGILPPPVRPVGPPAVDLQRERERLRLELLKRIVDREIRRQSSRSGVR
jgi:hypothetical protein